MFLQECAFCDETIEAHTVGEVQAGARDHLREEHLVEFEELFRRKYQGKDCVGGCGYSFPRDPDDHPGFECPECGRDHLSWFASQHVWSRTKER